MVDITYTELVRRVPLWLYADNTSLVDEMPNIITEAEDELILRLDHDLFQTALTGFTVGADPYDPNGTADLIDLSAEDPAIFEVRAIRLKLREQAHNWWPIHRRDIEMLSTLYANNSPGQPRFYATYPALLQYRVFPYPRTAYDVEITANVQPARLSNTVDTNVLTDQFPRAMEKATLRQAALFMKDSGAAATYEGEMMQSVNEANMQVSRRRRDETGVRPVETANATGR